MSTERIDEKGVFNTARKITDREARASYLELACIDHPEAMQRVLDLLRVHEDQQSFLDSPPQSLDITNALSPIEKQTCGPIGPYKLLQKLGEGGMGVVFMAEQTTPVKRRVALKIIKPGLDTDQVVARFEAERQALAMMEHPNIAKVLDAGATADGRPYFVMELVRGVPITAYCNEHRLNSRARLELFVSVCRGVQHAHLKGIIHRDLKPSNVLVADYDHHPVPKIIDFGVAKATSQELTEKTMFTQFGQIIGTLDFMSPEQVKFNQLDIDTRSDVYSLGVLLYELLTGETPIEKNRLRDSDLEEMLRIIREEDPPRPSTRLRSSTTLPTIAANRSTDPAKLATQLREDLDWIVIKAMAKERAERYQSAELLAADIERHLADLPIEARRPSMIGRARRFVRRHRMPVVMSMLVLAATAVAASMGGIAYMGRIRQAKQEVALETSRSETRQAEAEVDKQRWAHASLPQIMALSNEQRPVAAFELAKQVREVLAGDPDFEEVWDRVVFVPNNPLSIKPDGTTISYRDALDTDAPWIVAGQTPLAGVAFPRGNLRFRYSKPGYVTKELQRKFPNFLWSQGDSSLVKLKGDTLPAGNRLTTWIYGIEGSKWNRLPEELSLRTFHIDRYEVTNGDYQKFVDVGGYSDPAYWSEIEFQRDGKKVSWKQAMEAFVDSTGRHGPSTWSDGTYPAGQQDFPVGGVSWYEAVAYAAFVGKSLPTFYHWHWASDTDQPHILTALSNFSSQGPTPRGATQGIGRFEVYDLAGNVKEWCWNEDDQGRRALCGACWQDNDYMFRAQDGDDPWQRHATYGFRCIQYSSEEPEPASLAVLNTKAEAPIPSRNPLPIEPLLSFYFYDKELPLNAEVIHSEDLGPALGCRYEIVRIDTCYGEERMDLHFLIPREGRDHFEAVVVFPVNSEFHQRREFTPGKMHSWGSLERLVRSGRMVCCPEYNGTRKRWKDGLMSSYKDRPDQTRQAWIRVFKDLRRTVDYLQSRNDVNADRLIYYGMSRGAMEGPISLAVEPRFAAGILISGGYDWRRERRHFPELVVTNFAPHVRQPVLMINGRNDDLFELQRNQIPLFEDLGSEIKEHLLKPSFGHGVPADEVQKEMDSWLERVFADDSASTASAKDERTAESAE